MTSAMPGITLVILSTLAAVIAPREIYQQRAVLISLLQVTLIHTEYNEAVRTVSILSLLAINVVTAVRRGSLRVPDLPVSLFIIYMSLQPFIVGRGVGTIASNILQGVALLLLGGTVRQLGADALRPLLASTVVWISLNAISSTAERFFGMAAPWPRRDGTTVRNDGVNNLWDGAGGRAFGTTGWAITLGELAALLTIIAAWYARKHRSSRWLLVALLGCYIVALSGTRTAALMLAMAFVVYLISLTRRLIAIVPALAIAVLVVIEATVSVQGLFGFGSGSTDTVSVEHRRAVVKLLPDLVTQRPLHEVILGIGYDQNTVVLNLTLGESVDGIPVWDNELARSLVGIGIIGLVLMAFACLTVVRRSGALGRCLVAAFLVGAASYDSLSWRSLTTFLVVVLSLRLIPSQTPERDELPEDRRDDVPEPGKAPARLDPVVSRLV